MGAELITRAEWGARPSRGASSLAGTRGVKIHYTGSAESPLLREDDQHERCHARVRQVQAGHMDGNGWNDIGYTLVACHHGALFEGRGVHILPAANGPGLNSGHYAILALVGSSGLTEVTPGLRRALCDGIAYLREHGNAGGEVLGHRDGYATTCPGEELYAWVREGAPCAAAAPHSEGGEEMPRHVRVALGEPMDLPAGRWTSVYWRQDIRDPDHQHADGGGPSVLNGPAAYALAASLRLEGLPVGTEYQVRAVEVDAAGQESPMLGPILEGAATTGDTYVLYSLSAARVLEGRRVRVQVQPFKHAARLVGGSCEILFWR